MSLEMGSFWDRRVDEGVFSYVDNRMRYGRTHQERGDHRNMNLLGRLPAALCG